MKGTMINTETDEEARRTIERIDKIIKEVKEELQS